MNKKIGMFYFSGTGNTEIVASLIKKEFIENGHNVEIIKIEDVLNNNIVINPGKYDLIGLGNPVIGFGSPAIIYDFVKKLPHGKSKNVFIFKTAGGIAEQNYNSSSSIKKKLTKKGYIVIYERLFSIGSNWIIKFDNEITKQLYKATKHKIKLMCNEIINNKTRFLKTNYLTRIITRIVQSLDKLTIRFMAKDYKVTKECNLCGTCIKKCPVNNIFQKKNKIKFKSSCLWCMRCVYTCPKKAINHRLFSFCMVPGGYNPQIILNSPDNDNDLTDIFIPPFFNDYLKNDDM